MNSDKQIDDIAKLICTYPQCIHYNIIGECAKTECSTVDIAENLYNQDYRLASEVAEESSLYVHCSNCRAREYPREHHFKSKICPDCGARMDGERSENGN